MSCKAYHAIIHCASILLIILSYTYNIVLLTKIIILGYVTRFPPNLKQKVHTTFIKFGKDKKGRNKSRVMPIQIDLKCTRNHLTKTFILKTSPEKLKVT